MSGGVPAADRVEGALVLVPNPCTTQPCLPGMALAVDTGDGPCFLTRQGTWLMDPGALGPPPVAIGDLVRVTGSVNQAVDVRGEAFRTVELGSVERR